MKDGLNDVTTIKNPEIFGNNLLNLYGLRRRELWRACDSRWPTIVELDNNCKVGLKWYYFYGKNMSSMRDQCVWRPDAVSASFPENAPQAQRSSYQTTLTLLTHTLSEKQSRLSTRPLNGAIMTSKLPGALPGLFQPIDLSLIPLPSLIATTSNDLIAYIKDKEAIIKALNNPDDAVVDRIAALIRAADDTDMYAILSTSNIEFQVF